MRVAVFDTHGFVRQALEEENQRHAHVLVFFEPRLTSETAALAHGFDAVCVFVNDRVDAKTLETLARCGVKVVALRSAGFNNVDLEAAAAHGIRVVRVPEYSPHAVAEHAFALILSLVRKIHRAHARVREGNFSLDGLVGFDLHQKGFGVVGTGRIGRAAAQIARGFGCRVLAYDLAPHPELVAAGVEYISLAELYSTCELISLHVPLTPKTFHMIDRRAIDSMKPGIILVNTSRGALIDTRALIDALKTGHIGGAALDVYEEEEALFFKDHSNQPLLDDVLARLLTFPNVLITSHQGFLTKEALAAIAQTTLDSLDAVERGLPLKNEVRS
jgi:D-lactate dehydrogenase